VGSRSPNSVTVKVSNLTTWRDLTSPRPIDKYTMDTNAHFGVEANIDSLAINLLPFFQAYCCNVRASGAAAR